MNDTAWLNTLGLAYRARKVVTGEELVVKAIQKKKVFLVIVSEDASDNTKKKLKDKCTYYHVPLVIKGERRLIGSAIGKAERVVVGIEDPGFAKKIKTLIE
ncbi:ribosomal protein L7Ae-like RNA K-turn-binding protein [Evansella vedderi]|uniref:Ribosomal protein L7Ae-like RNA K-turn-binding protein n=1 Tax=Evansella vedderi TaxID=38282 RepID=A0ABT9ZR08_9BACI|nr:YlxQ family RNA-binding protein [Evansella vedderi]MDQ0253671.1 ribosomal protein L7Ae-like RNA K-turn-binding protein [Evansella vedderi]